jgi:phthalate 4,5-cis-dihydrodiol dehydrogenase
MNTESEGPPLGLGIVGLGVAGAVMVHAAAAHPGVKLRAAADPNAAPREAFARDFNASAYADIRQLCEDPAVDIVYIATPHQFHAAHVMLAAECGKHVIVEKPLALTLEDCDTIIAAVEKHGVHLVVGHTHAFDPAIRMMRQIIARGDLGPLALIAMWNYTNFLYRPRRPEELDTARGGGIVYNQIPHQIDIARLLGGGVVRSVRASAAVLDPERPTEGLSAALLQMDNGATASLVYSGYDHFDSDELHGWIAEAGLPKQPAHGGARRALAQRRGPEASVRADTLSYGAAPFVERPHQPHFGVVVATCAGGDLRPSADGLTIYDRNGARDVPIARKPGVPGRHEVLDDICAAIRTGERPVHDARWGKATVEVALALLQSAREGREITLRHQVPVRAEAGQAASAAE